MAQTIEGKKPVAKTLVYGIFTAILYAAAFAYGDTLTALFARGSFWAAAPIATVFAVSYLHGGFASNLWTCLGVEAKRPRTEKRTSTRPQPRATLNT
jgi:hypothetical protein